MAKEGRFPLIKGQGKQLGRILKSLRNSFSFKIFLYFTFGMQNSEKRSNLKFGSNFELLSEILELNSNTTNFVKIQHSQPSF